MRWGTRAGVEHVQLKSCLNRMMDGVRTDLHAHLLPVSSACDTSSFLCRALAIARDRTILACVTERAYFQMFSQSAARGI